VAQHTRGTGAGEDDNKEDYENMFDIELNSRERAIQKIYEYKF
jgi:hypothetical protein